MTVDRSRTVPEAEEDPGETTRDASLGIRVLVIVVAVLAAMAAGVALGGGGSRAAVLAPLMIVAVIGLAWLAMIRFTLFVAVILVLRSSLDALSFSSSGVDAFDPAALVSVGFLLAGSMWYAVQPRETRVPVSPMVAPMILLTVVGAVSTLLAPGAGAGLVDVIKLATVAMILLVMNQLLQDFRDARLITIAVFVSAVIPLGVAALQFLTDAGLHYSGTFGRVKATFEHPNPLAIYLTFVILMGVAMLPYVHRRLRPWLLGIVAASGVVLLLTYTRSAWIATFAGLLVIGYFYGKRVVGVVGLAAVAIMLTVPSVATRFADLDTTTTATGEAGNSLVWRFEYWNEALQLSDSPFLGEGLSAVRLEAAEAKAPHNDFIRVYVETGIAGLVAYLWFLVSAIRVAGVGLLEVHDSPYRGLVVGFAGVLAAFLILSLVSNVITQLVLLWYFATLASLATAAPRLAARDTRAVAV
ncbi:MAG: O-antigen ligase family protein [Actinomycetota bacterium]